MKKLAILLILSICFYSTQGTAQSFMERYGESKEEPAIIPPANSSSATTRHNTRVVQPQPVAAPSNQTRNTTPVPASPTPAEPATTKTVDNYIDQMISKDLSKDQPVNTALKQIGAALLKQKLKPN